MDTETIEATTHRQTYHSISDMMAACEKSVASGRRKLFSTCPDFTGRKGLQDWPSIKEAVSASWEDGLSIVQQMIYEIDREQLQLAQPVDVRRRKRWKDEGDELDNDRLRGGQEPWLATTRQEVRAPRQVTLFANLAAPGMKSPDEVLWRGAAAICLADMLERAGYRVEFWACHYVRNQHEDNKLSFTCAKVKEMSEPVDISSLINTVSCWFYRTVLFQCKQVPGLPVFSGLGRSMTITTEVDAVQEMAGNSIPVVIDAVFNRSAAMDLIRKTIASLEGM